MASLHALQAVVYWTCGKREVAKSYRVNDEMFVVAEFEGGWEEELPLTSDALVDGKLRRARLAFRLAFRITFGPCISSTAVDCNCCFSFRDWSANSPSSWS